ncbi:hypothetical protein ACOME3_006062 [Neoechinorhynchus agilis]
MRSIAGQKFDLVVSELLGSFGDNELAPECLAGMKNRLLNPGGIMIPYEYSSYLAPIECFGTYTAISALENASEGKFEIPYVVPFGAHELLGPCQELFKFESSKNEEGFDVRHGSIEFKLDHDGIIHGFSGYFHCRLFKQVFMSIHPEKHSKNLVSWFPIFFPLSNPFMVAKGSKIRIRFSRCGTAKRRCMWYEWSVVHPIVTHIHNAAGKYYRMFL